jgi:hypothetical protein
MTSRRSGSVREAIAAASARTTSAPMTAMATQLAP